MALFGLQTPADILPNPNGASSYNHYQNASLWQGIDNFFTGNLDYNRQLYLSNSAVQRASQDYSKAGFSPLNAIGNSASASYNSNGSSGVGHLISFLASLVSSSSRIASAAVSNAGALSRAVAINEAKEVLQDKRLNSALSGSRIALNDSLTKLYEKALKNGDKKNDLYKLPKWYNKPFNKIEASYKNKNYDSGEVIDIASYFGKK